MRILFLLALLSLTTAGLGQTLPAASSPPAAGPVPAKRVLYFDAQGFPLPGPEGADHREELVYRDSIGGTLKVYYPSGKLHRQMQYLHFARGLQHGVESSFYETGEIKSRGEYELNEKVGDYTLFYPNGTVMHRLHFTPAEEAQHKHKQKQKKTAPVEVTDFCQALFLESEWYASDGRRLLAAQTQCQAVSYHGGGNAAIVSAVQRAVRYPIEALRQQQKGKSFVRFTVDDAGFVRNVHVVKSAGALLDQATMEGVAQLGRLTPAHVNGITIDMTFTVPITFTIQ